MQLTPDQGKALAEIIAAERRGRHHLLTGDAGSGKTTLMQQFVRAMQKARRSVVLTAPTHKAVAVLARKIAEAEIVVECRTIQSLLSLKPRHDADRTLFERDYRADPVLQNVVVVDECSMISEELFGHIKRHLPVSFVLFVGDPAQLPPVGEKESLTFKTESRSHLNTIVRQAAGNPVLAAAHAIRASQGGPIDWSWCKSAHAKPCGVYVPADPDAWMRKAFTSPEFAQDPDRFRYLAWTNERVHQVNTKVRAWRYGEKAQAMPFLPGEIALVRAPIVLDDTILFATNEEAPVVSICRSEFNFSAPRLGDLTGWAARVPSWRIELENAAGETHPVHMVADPKVYAAVEARIKDEAGKHSDRWKEFHKFKQSLAKLQAVYSITVHNSQGSTFGTAFVDVPDIARRVPSNVLEAQQLLYVAATRPSESLIVVGGCP